LGEAEDEVDGLPRIFGLKRQMEKTIIPSNDTVIQSGDLVAFATVGQHSFRRILQACGHDPPIFPDQPRVLIFGANRLGQEVAQSYIDDGCQVTVVSESLEDANELAGSEFAGTDLIDVIHGDPMDTDLLREIDIDAHDVSIAVLDDDHTNIAVSLQAAEMGVVRTGLVLDDSQLAMVARRIGQSFAVSRRRVTVNKILQQVHSKVEGAFTLLASIKDLVFMSANVEEGHQLIDKTVSDLEADGKYRVAFIQRKGRQGGSSLLRASPEQSLRAGDRLMMFARVEDIEAIEEKLL